MNTAGHWFWWALTVACVIWYSTVTVYVAVKGVFDIKEMLARLAGRRVDDNQTGGN